jgi:asparagine synthase (glutamine-hydrolysing)
MRGRLPDEILRRKKVGFGVPLNRWLRESQRELVIDYLSPARLRAQNILDADAVAGIVEEHLSGRADRGHQIWLLLLFQLWHERWATAEPESDGVSRRSVAA